MAFEAPDGYLRQNSVGRELWELSSGYLITGPQLAGRLVVIRAPALHHVVMGLPLVIQDDKYHRNALLFSVGLVVTEGARTEQFEQALREVALTLHAMELESGFLSNSHTKVFRQCEREPKHTLAQTLTALDAESAQLHLGTRAEHARLW